MDGFTLNTDEDRCCNDLPERLENLSNITKCLQKASKTTSTVCALYNCVMGVFAVTAEWLFSSALKIQYPTLEYSIVKL